MSRVFRQQYTKPIPAGSQPTTMRLKKRGVEIEVPAVRFKGPDGKTVVAPITTKGKNAGKHCRVASPFWYGKVKGVVVCLECTNKAAAEMLLADKIRKVERGEAGLNDPFEAHRTAPLAEHLAGFRAHLESQGRARRYVDLVLSRVETVLTACGFRTLADVTADPVAAWLADQRSKAPAAVELDAREEGWTLEEVAALLGVKKFSVAPQMTRHGLHATGNGRARRFPRATVEALLAQRKGGLTADTSNSYVTQLKAFGNWLADGRLPDNPFRRLKRCKPGEDRKHARRELTADELQRVLMTTRASKRSFRGLTGEDRFHLYLLACGTGFRAGGLAGICPECFDLDETPPVVSLAVRTDKSRRGKVQPLPADVADLFRVYLVGKPAGQHLWPGTWASLRAAALMLRKDLRDAAVPYTVPGPNGPEHADFHALRHTYLTMLGRSGVDLRTQQELAGHASPVVTARYSHVRLHDLAGAVDRLPGLAPSQEAPKAQPQALPATGTAGPEASCLPAPYTPLTHSPDSGRGFPFAGDASTQQTPLPSSVHNPLPGKAVESKRGQKMTEDVSARHWIRTSDFHRVSEERTGHKDMQGKDFASGEGGTYTPLTQDGASGPLPLSADLAKIVQAWDELPLHIRTSILALVDAGRK